MWKRFIRAIKALFGGAVAAIEDPKLILEQNIRELQDQVPKMNQSIATVKASVTLLEKEYAKYKAEHNDLVTKMKAAINAGRDDIATQYAGRLETCKANLAQTEAQMISAQKAYEKALEVKKAFMKEKDRKINEAKEALRAHERAKWQAKIADTLESFEVVGVDQTHTEMINRINEQTAKNEARMEMALDSVDTSGMKLEEEAEKLRAQELVKQFKLEMGLGSNNVSSSTDTSNPIQNDSIQSKDGIL
ncbi:MAG: PspA/IM30 family protein [Bacteroidia bacterium]|nr:PspA/IM30 family protein [Bacteroidia bacterium]